MMQSVIEGEFEKRPTHDDATVAVDRVDANATEHQKVVAIDSAGDQAASEPAPQFDVSELERSMGELDAAGQLEKPDVFKPSDYADSKQSDRIISGYENGEPIYKQEPKPKAETRPQRSHKRRPPPRAARAARPSGERRHHSTHDLYRERAGDKKGFWAPGDSELNTYEIATKWVTKATHVAAIVIALLLILHYFPLPSGQ